MSNKSGRVTHVALSANLERFSRRPICLFSASFYNYQINSFQKVNYSLGRKGGGISWITFSAQQKSVT